MCCFGEFLLLVSSSARCSKRFWTLTLAKTFHFFPPINSLTELAGCFGSLSCWNLKSFLMSQVVFSWTLAAKTFLYTSAFILLSPSIKLSHACPCHDTTSTMLFRWGYMLWMICIFSLHTFAFPSHRWRLILVSSAQRTIFQNSSSSPFVQTLILPFYFWCWSEVCILLCSLCNSVSVSCGH